MFIATIDFYLHRIAIDRITEDELRGKKREPQNWTDKLPPPAAISVPVTAAPNCVVWPSKNHVNIEIIEKEVKPEIKKEEVKNEVKTGDNQQQKDKEKEEKDQNTN